MHSERPKLYAILAFLSAIGLNWQHSGGEKVWKKRNKSTFMLEFHYSDIDIVDANESDSGSYHVLAGKCL